MTRLGPHGWVDFQANLHQLIRFARVSQESTGKMEFFDNILKMFGGQRWLISAFRAFLNHDLKFKIFEKKFVSMAESSPQDWFPSIIKVDVNKYSIHIHFDENVPVKKMYALKVCINDCVEYIPHHTWNSLCTTLTLSGGFDICNSDDILLLNLKGLVSVFGFSMRKSSYKVPKVNTIKGIAITSAPNFLSLLRHIVGLQTFSTFQSLMEKIIDRDDKNKNIAVFAEIIELFDGNPVLIQHFESYLDKKINGIFKSQSGKLRPKIKSMRISLSQVLIEFQNYSPLNLCKTKLKLMAKNKEIKFFLKESTGKNVNQKVVLCGFKLIVGDKLTILNLDSLQDSMSNQLENDFGGVSIKEICMTPSQRISTHSKQYVQDNMSNFAVLEQQSGEASKAKSQSLTYREFIALIVAKLGPDKYKYFQAIFKKLDLRGTELDSVAQTKNESIYEEIVKLFHGDTQLCDQFENTMHGRKGDKKIFREARKKNLLKVSEIKNGPVTKLDFLANLPKSMPVLDAARNFDVCTPHLWFCSCHHKKCFNCRNCKRHCICVVGFSVREDFTDHQRKQIHLKSLVNRKISIIYGNKWYTAHTFLFNPDTMKHTIKYDDDNTTEIIDLEKLKKKKILKFLKGGQQPPIQYQLSEEEKLWRRKLGSIIRSQVRKETRSKTTLSQAIIYIHMVKKRIGEANTKVFLNLLSAYVDQTHLNFRKLVEFAEKHLGEADSTRLLDGLLHFLPDAQARRIRLAWVKTHFLPIGALDHAKQQQQGILAEKRTRGLGKKTLKRLEQESIRQHKNTIGVPGTSKDPFDYLEVQKKNSQKFDSPPSADFHASSLGLSNVHHNPGLPRAKSHGMEQNWNNVPEELQQNVPVEKNSLYHRAKRRKTQAFPTNNFT